MESVIRKNDREDSLQVNTRKPHVDGETSLDERSEEKQESVLQNMEKHIRDTQYASPESDKMTNVIKNK